MLKRLLDVVSAVVLLFLSIPVLAIAALLIKLDSRGPAIFCQTRMGKGFKTFKIFKLRTMRPDLEGPLYTLGPDPRITRIGGWLRRSKIDELPQLWNVVRGEMGIVGPRPVVPELAMEFRTSYCRLLAVRPGLTDPAALKYFGEVEMLSHIPEPLAYFKTVVTPDKLRISLAYLQRAGVRSDCSVMLQTIKAVFASMGRPLLPLRPRVVRTPVGRLISPRSAV